MKRSHLRSQNFIQRPNLVRTLVGHSNLTKNDTVYDIGAGSGVITSVLATLCRRVVAIESDTHMVAKLRDNTKEFRNVDVVAADFLQYPLPSEPYKVFANIPFHLSSPILRKLTDTDHPPASIYLIVQKQFAQKLQVGASTSFTGLLGAMIAPWFETRIRYRLERTDFWPNPAVDTAFIEIVCRNEPLLARSRKPAYDAFVEHCFARQKYFATLPADLTKGKRPSQLTAEEWVVLFQASSKS